MLDSPAEDHVVELAWRGLALAAILPALPGGHGRLEVGGRADGIDGRLLDDDAPVDKTFEVDEAKVFEVLQAVDSANADNAKIL